MSFLRKQLSSRIRYGCTMVSQTITLLKQVLWYLFFQPQPQPQCHLFIGYTKKYRIVRYYELKK